MNSGFFTGENTLNAFPKRIVSLVPSQTELLFDLGLEKEVVGITKFCIHPQEWFKTKTRVGGTKTVNMEKVKSLQPDFIIANKEENTQAQIDALSVIAPVWVSDVQTLEDALNMIRQVGIFTGTQEKAKTIIQKINSEFQQLADLKKNTGTAAYFIWRNPWMVSGTETFINDLLLKTGLKNVFEDKRRYPEITLEDLKNRNPDLILLSSEPFPFKEKHAAEIREVIPDAKIILVDGEMFSWYGSRLQYAPAYFRKVFKDNISSR